MNASRTRFDGAKPDYATDDDWVSAARHRAEPIGYWNAVNRGTKPALHVVGIKNGFGEPEVIHAKARSAFDVLEVPAS